MRKAVRVLVVDDSALMRKLIPKILEQDDSIEVVGTAMDGYFALKKIEDLSPDVVTLDLEMPGLNGIDTLKAIMRQGRLPVIVVSSHSTAGAAITLKALALGAFDFVAKPQDVSGHMPEIYGRSERLAISFFEAAGGIFREHSGGAAHARRVHGTVCQATGRELPDPGEGSAIGRLAGSRASADFSGEPAHESEETAAG